MSDIWKHALCSKPKNEMRMPKDSLVAAEILDVDVLLSGDINRAIQSLKDARFKLAQRGAYKFILNRENDKLYIRGYE